LAQVLARALLAGIIFSAAVQTAVLRAGMESPTLPGHIRVLDRRLADVIACGIQRSATLRRMVDRIAELDGIIYVTATVKVRPETNHVLRAALVHEVAVAGTSRILRVVVAHNHGDDAVATIAHELQHATEVLESPGVRSAADVTALFKRIGREVYAGVWETVEAGNIERTVAQELRASRSDPRCDASQW